MSPLNPQYKPPPFNEIHKGEGAMTQQEYMDYVNRSSTKPVEKTSINHIRNIRITKRVLALR